MSGGWKEEVVLRGELFGCAKVLGAGNTVKLIGVGEQIDDLLEFKPAEFVEALLS